MMQATKLRWFLGSVSLVGLAAFGMPAMAQSTDNLIVQATVNGDCSVTGATLNFGAYTGAEKDIAVPISFNCTAPSNVSIALNGGTVGDPTGRKMFNIANSDSIDYNLFQDAGRNTPWGIIPGNDQVFTNTTGGTPSVFGRIPAGQAPLPDTYSDTVVITLTTN